MNTKTITHEVTFSASPHEVYEALMDPVKHSKFTGFPAEIEREPGGRFMQNGGGHWGAVAATTLVAEWHQVKNGKISHVESAFDGRPFAAMFAGGKRT